MSASTVRRSILASVATLTIAACGTGESTSKDSAAPDGNTPATAAPSDAPAPTGTVITIEMITDDKGNYFKPADVTAKPGDVLRFVLVTGVHNVHFLPDSNPGVPSLPPASTFAQLPQQTIDVPVNFAAGKSYYYQCDPHAALGMIGHVKVEP